MRKAIYEFLVHGLPYIFPVRPGALVVGMPTAHSAPPLSATFGAADPVVWASSDGEVKGQEIFPFHPKQAHAAKLDNKLYELLALTDGRWVLAAADVPSSSSSSLITRGNNKCLPDYSL